MKNYTTKSLPVGWLLFLVPLLPCLMAGCGDPKPISPARPANIPTAIQQTPEQIQAQTKTRALSDARSYGYNYGNQWAPSAAKLGVLSIRSAPSNFELNELANIQWFTYSMLPEDGRPKIAALVEAMGGQNNYDQIKESWQSGFKSGVATGLQPEIERYKRGLAPAF